MSFFYCMQFLRKYTYVYKKPKSQDNGKKKL
jgi:hypothetical protein